MNTIKDTLVLKEDHPEMDIKVFYIDSRAFSKCFEEMLWRSKRLGVKYIRRIPSEVGEGGRARGAGDRCEAAGANETNSTAVSAATASGGSSP